MDALEELKKEAYASSAERFQLYVVSMPGKEPYAVWLNDLDALYQGFDPNKDAVTESTVADPNKRILSEGAYNALSKGLEQSIVDRMAREQKAEREAYSTRATILIFALAALAVMAWARS